MTFNHDGPLTLQSFAWFPHIFQFTLSLFRHNGSSICTTLCSMLFTRVPLATPKTGHEKDLIYTTLIIDKKVIGIRRTYISEYVFTSGIPEMREGRHAVQGKTFTRLHLHVKVSYVA